jgi:hypothetical protein
MAYFDLVVIYLACGAPFGVYELTITHGTGNVALRSLAAIVLWPIFAVGHLKRFSRPDTHLQTEVQLLRTRLEQAVFSNASSGEIFEFRRAYQQLTGLANLVNERPSSTYELFGVTDHPDPRLASVCVARRNSSRVDFHLERARQDLVRVIFSTLPERTETVVNLLKELGDLTGSPDLARRPLGTATFAVCKDKYPAAVSAIEH